MQTIMKTIINKISIILLVTLTMACVEESLDPVKFAEVKKATMLALRGTAFNNLSSNGDGNEKALPGTVATSLRARGFSF